MSDELRVAIAALYRTLDTARDHVDGAALHAQLDHGDAAAVEHRLAHAEAALRSAVDRAKRAKLEARRVVRARR